MRPPKAKKRQRPRAAVNHVTASYRIADALWAVLQPLLPVHVNSHRFGGGRPRVPDRQCADAIFYVLRTGCQWGALDATDLCRRSTAPERFQEWVAAGVFLQLWQAGVEQLEELQGDRLGVAEPGRRHDEGALWRGKKPAPIPRIGPKAESSAVC